jgi:hypothetical protein
MWEREPSLQDEIKKTSEGNMQVHSMGDIQQGLGKMRKSLSQWSADNFGSATKELRKIRERMENISKHDG